VTQALTTATQNLVVAFNGQTKALQHTAGQYTTVTYTGPSQVVINAGSCRLVQVCIVSEGTGTVQFYNTASTNSLPDGSLLYVMPQTSLSTVWLVPVGLQFSLGLAVFITGNISLNVTYSVD
jgi:hypothetical protein